MWSYLVSPEAKVIGLGAHGHAHYGRTLGFVCLLESEIGSYESQMKQNNSTELLGNSFITFYNKSLPPDPPRPQNQIFP